MFVDIAECKRVYLYIPFPEASYAFRFFSVSSEENREYTRIGIQAIISFAF